MRIGDFGVEVLPNGGGVVRETESGHVLARPGQVYRLRLRNYGPLRCVVRVDIDGRSVTAGGLVLDAWKWTDLERPVDGGDHGRFTVIAEGDESVFGPDGGRDNESLGLIEASFRRELPSPRDSVPYPTLPYPRGEDAPARPYRVTPSRAVISSLRSMESPWQPEVAEPFARPGRDGGIERAAGTGLTGHSNQEFVPVHVGTLESEATLLRLRLVVGSEEAIADDSPRPLPGLRAPERPAPRP